MKKLFFLVLFIAVIIGVIYVLKPAKPPASPSPLPEPEIPYEPNPTPSTPENAIDAVLGSARALDLETLKSLLGDASGLKLGSLSEEYKELLLPFTRRVNWEVGTVETGEDGVAAASISITAPNMKGTVTALGADIVKYTAAQKLKGGELDYDSHIKEYLAEKVDWANLPTTTTEITVHLKMDKKGVWRIDNDSNDMEELMDALTGGLSGTLESLTSYVGGASGAKA